MSNIRKFDTKVQYLKYKVLREVAREAWNDTLLENLIDIPKKIQYEFQENQCYIIELDNILLDKEVEENIGLAVNWNNSQFPSCKFYKIDVIKIMGKMIKCNGIGYDYNNNQDLNILWSGWLPKDKIKIINKI